MFPEMKSPTRQKSKQKLVLKWGAWPLTELGKRFLQPWQPQITVILLLTLMQRTMFSHFHFLLTDCKQSNNCQRPDIPLRFRHFFCLPTLTEAANNSPNWNKRNPYTFIPSRSPVIFVASLTGSGHVYYWQCLKAYSLIYLQTSCTHHKTVGWWCPHFYSPRPRSSLVFGTQDHTQQYSGVVRKAQVH